MGTGAVLHIPRSVISVPEDHELLTLGALPTENLGVCYVMCGSGAGEVS